MRKLWYEAIAAQRLQIFFQSKLSRMARRRRAVVPACVLAAASACVLFGRGMGQETGAPSAADAWLPPGWRAVPHATRRVYYWDMTTNRSKPEP
jgi:hypothetical protein